ncbi:hypothetical protein ACFL6L_03830 [candidate division KSB1 bacterium]
MAAQYTKMQEIISVSLTAGNTRQARTWINTAAQIEADLINDFNSRVLPLRQQLSGMALNESAEKQVNEFMARIRDLISIESLRNTLSAKNDVGLRVTSDDWRALAIMYKNLDDAYDRNVGLRALGNTVAPFNNSLAESIFGMLDSPYFVALHTIENTEDFDIDELLSGIDDPYLGIQVLIKARQKKQEPEYITKLTELVDTIEDHNEKAFMAALILSEVAVLGERSKEPFLTAIEGADDLQLLMLETEYNIGKKAGSTPFRGPDINTIPQNYPRERLLTNAFMNACNQMTLENLMKAMGELEITSLTLHEQLLTYIVTHKEDITDAQSDSLVGLMHEPYSKFTAMIDRFYKKNPEGEEAVKYLEPLIAFVDEINEPRPKIDYVKAWAHVDPFKARQHLNALDTKTKVDAAAEILAVIDDENTSMIIVNDLYTEISGAKQLEPLEKAQLLKKLAGAALNINRTRAMDFLEESFTLLTQN